MILDEVLTIAEAAELWGLARGTLRKAVLGQRGYPPRFKPEECRQSASVYLVTRAAMVRLYGPQPNVEGVKNED